MYAGLGRLPMPKSRSAGLPLNDHLFFPVQLDRRKITATIDTGAQRTTLSAATARAMGITDAVLAHDPPILHQGVRRTAALASRIHRFDSLTVGNIGLSNPEIVVTDLRLRGIDLILGMDFLRFATPLAFLRGLPRLSFEQIRRYGFRNPIRL